MRKSLALLAVAFAVGITGSFDAEAKRLGGAKSSGMQRQSVNQPAQPAQPRDVNGAPSTAAAPAAATAAAAPAAAAAKRSWMGPVAGLAAGLGIAALASHFGFGEALANLLTIALVAMAVLVLAGLLLRSRARQQGGPAWAGAGAGTGGGTAFGRVQRSPLRQPGSLIGSALGGSAGSAAAAAAPIPAGFDAAAFERNAKVQFMALQAAHDAGDLDRLAGYLTPEMLDVARQDLAAREGRPQATEVFGLHAQVLEVEQGSGRYVVSVRFTGSVRDEAGVAPEPFDEVWHLAKPAMGSEGWRVAGIQQAGTP